MASSLPLSLSRARAQGCTHTGEATPTRSRWASACVATPQIVCVTNPNPNPNQREQHLVGQDVDRLARRLCRPHDQLGRVRGGAAVEAAEVERRLALQVVDFEVLQHAALRLRVVACEPQARVLHLLEDHVAVEPHRVEAAHVVRLGAVAKGLAEQSGRPAKEDVEASALRRRLGLIHEQHALAQVRPLERASYARRPARRVGPCGYGGAGRRGWGSRGGRLRSPAAHHDEVVWLLQVGTWYAPYLHLRRHGGSRTRERRTRSAMPVRGWNVRGRETAEEKHHRPRQMLLSAAVDLQV